MHDAAYDVSAYRRSPASRLRMLAERPAKKGSSLERLARWRVKHGNRVYAFQRTITRFFVGPTGALVPRARLTCRGHERFRPDGTPKSKTYDRRGRR